MPNQQNDTLPSLVRTIVPLIVGSVVAWAAHHGIAIDPYVLTAVITAVYYALVRVAEQKLGASWGWLLGYAKAPAYATGPPPQPEPVVVPTPPSP